MYPCKIANDVSYDCGNHNIVVQLYVHCIGYRCLFSMVSIVLNALTIVMISLGAFMPYFLQKSD